MGNRLLAAVARNPASAPAAMATALVLASLPAIAQAAPPTRIASPANGALVTGPPLKIVVHTAPRTARLRAWLGFTEITRAFSRGGSVATATIRLGQGLGYGTNVLSVTTTGPGGTSYSFSTFVLGRRAPALLRASGPSLSPAPVALTATAGLGTVFGASLNGRSVTRAFTQGSFGRWSTRLGADDGLRFGSNTLRITVYNQRSGSFDRQLRMITVPRTRPLVGAGADQFGWTGSQVALTGLSSRPFRPQDRLTYRWRLVRRPRGSRAALLNSGSARPRLVPDVRGQYVARLTVSERCGRRPCSSSDDVTILATGGLPIGSRLQTRDSSGAILLEGKVAAAGGGNGSYAIFDRDTLEPKGSGTYQYTAASLTALESKLRPLVSTPPRLLVVINGGPGLPPELADRLNALLGSLGATAFDKQRLTARDAGWSVVGPPGAPAGSATENLELGSDPGKPSLPGAMSGYLQANPANHYYGFAPQDAVPFDTLPTPQPARGNTMMVGGKAYTGTLPVGQTTGFHVVSLDARSLKPVDEKVFATPGDEGSLLTWLTAQASSPIKPLVLIASIGSPKPGTDPRWGDIAVQIAKLGGTAAVFNGLNGTGGYALVGRVGTTQLSEAATAVTGKTARLTGILGRTPDFGYEPLASSSEPESADELLAIASQAPRSWPEIDANADRYITLRLGFSGSDLRRYFYVDYATPAAWAKRQGDVRALPYPMGDVDFSKAAFEEAKAELADEIGAVVEVEDYVNRLRSPFTESAKEHVSLQKISLAIQQQFAPKPGLNAYPAFTVLSKLFAVAGEYFEIEEFATAGMIAGAMAYLQYLPRPSGEDILGKIQAKTDELATDLDIRYDEARQAMTQLGMVLVSDWGKLTTVGGSPKWGIAGKVHSEGWILPGEPDALKLPVIKAAKQVFFSALMRTVWDTWNIRGGVGNARDWYCVHTIKVRKETIRRFLHYWGKEPDAGQFRVITGFGPGGAPAVAQRALGVPKTETFADAQPPPDSLVKPLFEPVDRDPQTNRLGLFAPWFYRDFTVNEPSVGYKAKC